MIHIDHKTKKGAKMTPRAQLIQMPAPVGPAIPGNTASAASAASATLPSKDDKFTVLKKTGAAGLVQAGFICWNIVKQKAVSPT